MGSGLCFSYPFQFSSRAAGFAGPLPSPRQPADRCDAIPHALCHCMVLLFSSNDLGDAFSYSHKGRLIIIPLDGHPACHVWTMASHQDAFRFTCSDFKNDRFVPRSLRSVPSRHCLSKKNARESESKLLFPRIISMNL